MKKLIGLFASVALMGSGVALANEGKKHDKEQTQTQGSMQPGSDIGGSGQQGSQLGTGTQTQVGQSGMTNQLSGNQITGRVVKSDRKTIWVEHAGAIVPLKVDKNTQFTDPNLKRASDFKEGEQIRASFEVRKTDNVATSIEKSTGAGMGGSGSDVMEPDQGINQPDTLPPANDGTGGAGTGSDIDPQGSDLGTGSDVKDGKTSGDF
ncbi:hypothetical protein [Hyalangium sp.]|uniref:hypothetical protein n=1 Tax=Hyalangium sp. TaxID=2028555 RepID=UPI002D5EE99D|nr:hypothetical protein [Hyalangium sp.]HYH95832.1 hypothetical protein [Hyalangium sp.]